MLEELSIYKPTGDKLQYTPIQDMTKIVLLNLNEYKGESLRKKREPII